jgi:hypothetical protein
MSVFLMLPHNPEVGGSNPPPAIDVSEAVAMSYIALPFLFFGGRVTKL